MNKPTGPHSEQSLSHRIEPSITTNTESVSTNTMPETDPIAATKIDGNTTKTHGINRPLKGRRRQRPGFRLTSRDYLIFRFLLDQKFSSLEILFFRFFDGRASVGEALPSQFRVARQRLQILKRYGFIHTQYSHLESKALYLLSVKGYRLLQEKVGYSLYAPNVTAIDFRSFDHDMRVNLVRAALERGSKAHKWYPERRIRMQGLKVQGVDRELPESLIPDAVFISSKGERVALEVEVSVRKKSRFRHKIEEYESCISKYPGSEPLIHWVLFIACSDDVGKDLSELTKGRDGFIVETYSHFKSSLCGNSGSEKVQNYKGKNTGKFSKGDDWKQGNGVGLKRDWAVNRDSDDDFEEEEGNFS